MLEITLEGIVKELTELSKNYGAKEDKSTETNSISIGLSRAENAAE